MRRPFLYNRQIDQKIRNIEHAVKGILKHSDHVQWYKRREAKIQKPEQPVKERDAPLFHPAQQQGHKQSCQESLNTCIYVSSLLRADHAAEDLREIDKDQCVCHRVVVIEKAADQRLIGSPVDLDRHRIRDIVLDLICRIQT